MNKLMISALIASTVTLSGCAGLAIGGAAVAGGAVAATMHDRRTPGTVIDDKNLDLLIGKKLLSDKYLKSYSHTNTTVHNGIVLITGEASSQEVANRILAVVKDTPNIKRIESDIVIAPKSSLLSRGNDSAITGKVRAALLSVKLPNFDPTLINISTERGKVYLMGIVTHQEAHAITETARRVKGVKSVTKLFEYLD